MCQPPARRASPRAVATPCRPRSRRPRCAPGQSRRAASGGGPRASAGPQSRERDLVFRRPGRLAHIAALLSCFAGWVQPHSRPAVVLHEVKTLRNCSRRPRCQSKAGRAAVRAVSKRSSACSRHGCGRARHIAAPCELRALCAGGAARSGAMRTALPLVACARTGWVSSWRLGELWNLFWGCISRLSRPDVIDIDVRWRCCDTQTLGCGK